jgi:uncharacterized protein YgbK (DUF1537 family)
MAQATAELKVVVIDDDPTGSQTVHSCPLLLRWDAASLAEGLAHPSPLLFLLANTRALAPAPAEARVREICRALRPALAAMARPWLVVSRGDSTLRGHFPLEVEVIAAELGPFDATLLVPAFLEGGRTTVDGVHRLHGRPVHESEFARDRLFGYRSSHLPDWVAEKSGGRIPAAAVAQIGLAELEAGGEGLRRRLADFSSNAMVAVDAEQPRHLAALGAAVRELVAGDAGERWGRPCRFLFQSAASLLNGLADLPPPPLTAAALAGLRRREPTGADPEGANPTGARLPGLVLVGSHVPLADAQLARLLAEPGCGAVEIPVARVQRVLEGPLPDRLLASLEVEWRQALEAQLAAGRTPVLHTSRGEVLCRHPAERRALGLALAAVMARLAASLAPRLGYLISKGGITSHTLLADGLELASVELQGQLLPGLSLVRAPRGGVPGAAGLPVLTLPGNLGDGETLAAVWRQMEAA